MSQRHNNYYGFVRTGFAKKLPAPDSFFQIFGATWFTEEEEEGCHFGAHWILKGVPKSSFLDMQANRMRNNGVIDRVLKKHEFQLIFDANIQGLM